MTNKGTKNESDAYHGRITDEGVNQLRSRIGRPIPEQAFGPPIPTAGIDAIRLWAWGIGDDNPLYTDLKYAAATNWETVQAPPSIVLGMDPHRLGIMGGLAGVHALYAGVNFEWSRPIPLGTQIQTSASIASVTERRDSKVSGRSVKVISETRIATNGGVDLATMQHVVTRHERAETRERGNFATDAEQIPYQYTASEVAEIADAYRQERVNRRADTPRMWESVEIGDELPTIIKGPLTVTGIIAFTMAVRPVHLTLGHRLAFSLFDAHPGTAIPNEFNVPEPPISVHWNENQARFSGLPTAYDFGMERACWASHLFTDWMGDRGFLKSLSVRFRGPNYLGDLTTLTGTVEDKWQEGGIGMVRCAYIATNQRGQQTTIGDAVVALPSAESEPATVFQRA